MIIYHFLKIQNDLHIILEIKNKFKQVTHVGLHTSEGINRKESLW